MGESKAFFVYGTLKSGELRNNVFEHFLGHNNFKTIEGKVFGKLYDLGEFPGMTKGTDRVYGEVVILSEKDYYKILPVLDVIEGYDENDNNSFYVRQDIGVTTSEGNIVATVYFFNDTTILDNYGEYLASGTWSTQDETI